MYKPVYNAIDSGRALKGFVYQGFAIDLFIRAALRDIDTKAFGIIWRDLQPDVLNASIIYQSSSLNYDALIDPDPGFAFTREVKFAQRRWQFQVNSKQDRCF